MSSYPPSAATDAALPHDSLVARLIGICSAMLVLVTLVVAVRFWIRLQLVKTRFGADDWCILAAWALGAVVDLDPINQTKFGLGKHVYDLPPGTESYKSLELYYFGEMSYYACVALTKIAILCLYLRLAFKKNFRRLIWACMGLVIVPVLIFEGVTIFQCIPIHKAWDATVPGTCVNVNAVFYAHAGLDIFQDAVVYILPLRMLYQLQIPTRQKIALMMVFIVGGFVVITGMVRLNFLKVAQNTQDPSYDNYGGAIWSSIESNIGVVVACLPAFKALIDRLFPSLLGQTSKLSKELPLGASALKKQGYTRSYGPEEVELGSGVAWKNIGQEAGSNETGPNHGFSAGDKLSSPLDSGRVHLKNDGGPDHGNDIWKSTTVTVRRGQT